MKQTCLCRSTQGLGQGVALLALRLFAAYEFGEAGLEKWRGENWFADIREAFPFPFDLLPAGLSWNLAMGAELLVPLLLVFGLFTRLGAAALMVLTGMRCTRATATTFVTTVIKWLSFICFFCCRCCCRVRAGSRSMRCWRGAGRRQTSRKEYRPSEKGRKAVALR